MLSRQPGDRTFPTLITLLVLGLLLMTFDVRSEGGGVTGLLRTGTQSMVAPLQKGAAFVVNPVVDVIDSLTNVATLREQNRALQQDLAEAQAALVAVDDDLARLELYEQLYRLEATGTAIGRTVGQVIGQRPRFVAHPGLEGGHELGLVDQADLERDQPEEEMVLGGGHGLGSDRRRPVRPAPRRRGPARAAGRLAPIIA